MMAEACYVPKYLDASYKLQSFKATEVTSTHGRRGAEGEFPFGEQTGYADLGRKIRRYSITARFDGNNHIAQAALLIAAVELPGPGVLVHPTRGVILSAACTELVVRDEVEDGQGVTLLDMTFVEANNWPNGLGLVGQLLGLLLTPILTEARSSFTTRYKIDEIQEFRKDAVIQAAQDQVSAVAASYAGATTSMSDDITRNRVIYDLGVISSDKDEAAKTNTVDRAISLGMGAVAGKLTGAAKFDVFRTLANGAARDSSFFSPAADAENSIYSLVRLTAAAYMAQAVMEGGDYRTGDIFEQGDAIDAILGQEKDIAFTNCQNSLFSAIVEFRTEVAAQVSKKAYDAPGVVEYNFAGAVHPLVAAYSIHGDARRHREIEGLNVVGVQGRVSGDVLAQGGR